MGCGVEVRGEGKRGTGGRGGGERGGGGERSERWMIIAINNDYTPFQLVFMVLMNVVPMSQQKAFEVTFRIHENGHAVVYSGLKTHCETIKKELQAISVNSIIESQSCFDV